MRVKFNEVEYVKRGRNGRALKDLCFDIFQKYLDENPTLNYEKLQIIFNPWHCNNRKVLLTEDEWDKQTSDGQSRYFNPIEYNGVKLYFTTQWGNNGGECDNINKVINFAKEQGYDIFIIEGESSNQEIKIQNKIMNTKNIILYGPPGVGKTYNHKKLISLIESEKNQKDIFDAIKNNDLENDEILFETVKEENRFKFVTFHQSYSYEDFIEGFRPNEDGTIKLEDGIFKEIARVAQENIDNASTNHIMPFSEALDKVLKEIENGDNIRVDLKRTGSYYEVYDYTPRTIFFTKQKGDSEHSLSIRTLEKMYKSEDTQDIKGGMASYYQALLNKLLELKYKSDKQNEPQKNFYLLIDEINRGNISKIFGELITLIEDDKRDEIEVTLPYSKELFKVPSNLYIIATMNSTDKSIALIDVALRRRFTFLKMKPNELLVDDEALEVFKKLNEIIVDKLGEDYQIGHSYFMDSNLDFVLEYKLKPLLEEYFYSDEAGLKESLEIIEKYS